MIPCAKTAALEPGLQSIHNQIGAFGGASVFALVTSFVCGGVLQVYVNYWRAIMEHFMKAGLAHVGRSKEQISSILDTFFNRMTAAAMANPQPASYPATRVLLRRRY